MINCSASSDAVAAKTGGGDSGESRVRFRSDREESSEFIDIASIEMGMSSRNLSTEQFSDLQVESIILLRWSGTICLPCLAELWKKLTFLLLKSGIARMLASLH